MAHPILYEINTRPWLRELSEKCGRPVLLDSVPESEITAWRRFGFTHVWLMGVWSGGPLARAKAFGAPHQQRGYAAALPDWRPEDVSGSPYAVADYRVADSLGGEEGLRTFRQRLHQHGLKLVLDFVPNHLGIDHPWVRERPDLFVQSPIPAPETFAVQSAVGTKWLAHGKDPYFPAWTDTAQLDYRRRATRQAMAELLMDVAGRCDGLRCDMSMLLLNNVFSKTWERLPSSEPAPPDEFWGSAIAETRRAYPEFMFLAEAYWGLEPQLQALGFDYTYDKALYDKILSADPAAVQQHLRSLPPETLEAGAHFLENHDEPRIASLLTFPRHRAAALLILGLPGMRLLHEGQLSGARLKSPVQLSRRFPEPEQPEIKEMYEQLLTTLKGTAVGHGTAKLLNPQLLPGADHSGRDTVIIQWQARSSEFDVVVINLSDHQDQCRVPLTVAQLPGKQWHMKDLAGTTEQTWDGQELVGPGLKLELTAYATQLLHFEANPHSGQRAD